MEHGALRIKDENVILICSAPDIPSVRAFKLNEAHVLSEHSELIISAVSLVRENLYKVLIHCPDENCYLYVQFGPSGITLRVGSPSQVYLVISPGFLTGLSVPFRHIKFNGEILDEANLTEYGFGLYGHPVPDFQNESFVQLYGQNDIVRPYPILGGERVYFSLSVDLYALSLTVEETVFTVSLDESKSVMKSAISPKLMAILDKIISLSVK